MKNNLLYKAESLDEDLPALKKMQNKSLPKESLTHKSENKLIGNSLDEEYDKVGSEESEENVKKLKINKIKEEFEKKESLSTPQDKRRQDKNEKSNNSYKATPYQVKDIVNSKEDRVSIIRSKAEYLKSEDPRSFSLRHHTKKRTILNLEAQAGKKQELSFLSGSLFNLLTFFNFLVSLLLLSLMIFYQVFIGTL